MLFKEIINKSNGIIVHTVYLADPAPRFNTFFMLNPAEHEI